MSTRHSRKSRKYLRTGYFRGIYRYSWTEYIATALSHRIHIMTISLPLISIVPDSR